MSKRRGKKKKEAKVLRSVKQDFTALKPETLRTAVGILLVLITIFLVLSIFEKAGVIGEYSYTALAYLFGTGYYVLPFLFVILAVIAFYNIHKKISWSDTFAGVLFLLSSLGIIELLLPEKGGLFGRLFSQPLQMLFEWQFSLILLIGLLIVSLVIITDIPLRLPFGKKGKEDKKDLNVAPEATGEPTPEPLQNEQKATPEPAPEQEKKERKIFAKKATPKEPETLTIEPILTSMKPYKTPPLSLLSKDNGKPSVGDVKANQNSIKRTLASFGVTVEMD